MEYTESSDAEYDAGLQSLQIKGLFFEGTCIACPEQYDVYFEGKITCYVRLRHGQLRAYYPDVGGEVIYSQHFEDQWLGEFPSEEERKLHLTKIAEIVNAKRCAEDQGGH